MTLNAGKPSTYGWLIAVVGNPSISASRTERPSSAYWNTDAWLKKTIEPLPLTPCIGRAVWGVGASLLSVVTMYRSKSGINNSTHQFEDLCAGIGLTSDVDIEMNE